MCRVSDSHLYVLTCSERQLTIKEFKKDQCLWLKDVEYVALNVDDIHVWNFYFMFCKNISVGLNQHVWEQRDCTPEIINVYVFSKILKSTPFVSEELYKNLM